MVNWLQCAVPCDIVRAVPCDIVQDMTYAVRGDMDGGLTTGVVTRAAVARRDIILHRSTSTHVHQAPVGTQWSYTVVHCTCIHQPCTH